MEAAISDNPNWGNPRRQKPDASRPRTPQQDYHRQQHHTNTQPQQQEDEQDEGLTTRETTLLTGPLDTG